MVKISLSKHAEAKFAVLAKHGVYISRQKVTETVRKPDAIDRRRLPLLIAQRSLDTRRVLRVVYRKTEHGIFIVTFYPGRKSAYEKE